MKILGNCPGRTDEPASSDLRMLFRFVVAIVSKNPELAWDSVKTETVVSAARGVVRRGPES
ncbi:hypothetical protein JMJ77_0014280 [Colletotrichum scovillei]|uniref:Uncharacterized protein n=1 Tax=Colletotrichum scovillei TaxID=1209932 RepID=A0A9P7R5M9_9PEZI|nr:hypothetical protein JMJ77_0014280 [Colletotrichum scovillei]KAG7065809.1 hypothetical protein JMJ78_0012555 [Colletotrichum scovillei]KAG7068409.1 hypothetical protein JMJ76_0008098 [Colletotrichum scovillei]